MPKYGRLIWVRNKGYGSLNVTTTVFGSGASTLSIGPNRLAAVMAFVAGSRSRSQRRLTALESSAVPSWNFTPLRMMNARLLSPDMSLRGLHSDGNRCNGYHDVGLQQRLTDEYTGDVGEHVRGNVRNEVESRAADVRREHHVA